MKNLQKLTGLLVCGVFVLFINACDSQDKINETGTTSEKTERIAGLLATDETTLNLCYNVVSVDSAYEGSTNAYNWIFSDSNLTPLDTLEVKILKQDLIALQNDILVSHTHTPCDGFVTGLQVLLAMDGNNLKLFYLPMQMCRVIDTDNFTVNTSPFVTLYYSETGFRPANPDELRWIRNYQTHVAFKESDTYTRPFNPSMDSTGDTRAVMLTFQAMNAVLDHNESDTLKIWNFAFRIPNAPAESSIRQSLLLGPHTMTPALLKKLRKNKNAGNLFLFGAFTGRFADRSHLCPPSCDIMLLTSSTSTNDCQAR